MRLQPIEKAGIDLAELEDDRRRNEEDRKRMQEAYARWLEEKGVLAPAKRKRSRRA